MLARLQLLIFIPTIFKRARKLFLVALFPALSVANFFQAHAQQPEARYDNRVLLVFDTSWTMKARLPKTQAAMAQLLSTMTMTRDLRDGDTVGVWTFGKNVSAGKFPLQFWSVNASGTIISNIASFVRQQSYAGSTRFDSVMPLVPNIVANSDRLTLIFFCDGDGKIMGTPYDEAINGIFGQRHIPARNAGQPFIVIFRAQLGRYVGCRVDVPPEMDIPVFPQFPAPPVPLFTPPPAKVAPPVVHTEPPLLIVGTNVFSGESVRTNAPALMKSVAKTNPPVPPPVPTNAVEEILKTNAAIVSATNRLAETNVAPAVTNVPALVETNLPRTNAIAVVPTNPPMPISRNVPQIPATNNLPPTNHVSAATVTDDSGDEKKYAFAAAGFLAAAIIVTILLFRRSRKANSSSLITRSMNKK